MKKRGSEIKSSYKYFWKKQTLLYNPSAPLHHIWRYKKLKFFICFFKKSSKAQLWTIAFSPKHPEISKIFFLKLGVHRLFQSSFRNIHLITENAIKGMKLKILKNYDPITYKLHIRTIVQNFKFRALFLPNHAILVRRVNFWLKRTFEPCKNFLRN